MSLDPEILATVIQEWGDATAAVLDWVNEDPDNRLSAASVRLAEAYLDMGALATEWEL